MKLLIALGLCLTALVGVVFATGTATDMTTSPSASVATTATPTVLNVVEITHTVPAGTAPVTAFTVPAGQTLIVTDVLVTNTGASATCGGAISRAAGAAAGTITQTDSTVTGPLCVASRTTTALPLTTGIEFGPGQTVQLINTPDPTAPVAAAPAAATGGLAFHLRGMLVAS